MVHAGTIKRIILQLSLFCFFSQGFAQEWQWSASLRGNISGETKAPPTAFLWIPTDCQVIKGVVVGQHNMLEEGIFEHREFRKTLGRLGFAEIWITPGPDLVFDFNAGAGTDFNLMMKDLAANSGYTELEFAPVVPIGHSAAASFPWNFGAWNPDRTLAMISIHGDAPLTHLTGSGKPNPDWGSRNIDGIPGLFIMGEYEWWEDRITPAMNYKKMNPKAVIAYLADAGHGHFDYSDELVHYLGMFLTKVSRARLPQYPVKGQPVRLKQVDPETGWLVDKWSKDLPLRAKSAKYTDYLGGKDEAGWAADRQMARATEQYYAASRGKKLQFIGFRQQQKLLAPSGFSGYNPRFIPLADGISFRLSAVFLDTVGGKSVSERHSRGKITINRICGPVEKINDSTFRIAFYRMGFNNSKRSNDIWLIARTKGDKRYKSMVQQAEMRIPLSITGGKDQFINFPSIAIQKSGSRPLKLCATATSGLPVSYYIKEGPAEIEHGKLVFTKIPPRSKFPIRVTVVAWQYGRDEPVKINTAAPVSQTFYLTR